MSSKPKNITLDKQLGHCYPKSMDTLTNARDTAFSYLEDFWADDDNLISLPVDPVRIASKVNMKVSVADLDGVLGVLVHEDDETRMILERKTDKRYAAFTAAYLLGRNILSTNETRYGFVASAATAIKINHSTEEEEFAHAFAYELLMPGTVMRQYWAKGKSIKWLSKHLDLPRYMIEQRLAMLHLY